MIFLNLNIKNFNKWKSAFAFIGIKNKLLFDKPDICKYIEKLRRIEDRYKLELYSVPPIQVRKILSLLDKIISGIKSINIENEDKRMAISMFQEKKTIILYFLGEIQLPNNMIEITCSDRSMVINKSELSRLPNKLI